MSVHLPLAAVPAVFVDAHLLRCRTPDFSRYSIGLPHVLQVEVSLTRGAQWSASRAPFTLYSARPSIDAFGRPLWGYDASFELAAWEVPSAANQYVWRVDPLYAARGHPLARGRPSDWDARADPFHTRGAEARLSPTATDTGDRMPPAEDSREAGVLASKSGVEGSWGDRKSFLRAHYLVPDTYRHKVIAARQAAIAHAAKLPDGEI